jgi:6-phospho-beta-glucosidase
MAMRTIPVLLEYVRTMRESCPEAWLVNFANPSGMLAEAVTRAAGWERAVGICDAPQGMRRVAAALLQVPGEEIFLDYFGLNHLGWVRAVIYRGRDVLPQFLEMIGRTGTFPGGLFPPELVLALGLIPNEYLFFYYRTAQAVRNILGAGKTRGEQLAALNAQLFADLRRLQAEGNLQGMQAAYQACLERRQQTYMATETGSGQSLAALDQGTTEDAGSGGYAGVALDLIEGLAGAAPKAQVLNVPNRGAIAGMADEDVVEVPAYVARGLVRPLAVGQIPDHCLGLMKQVKAYERLTIAAAVEGSYEKALQALALHPLVPDHAAAKAILQEYRERHGLLFPKLQ